jgi:hypothetical protein
MNNNVSVLLFIKKRIGPRTGGAGSKHVSKKQVIGVIFSAGISLRWQESMKRRGREIYGWYMWGSLYSSRLSGITRQSIDALKLAKRLACRPWISTGQRFVLI